MASPIVVKRALKAFANNYGKPEQWVDDTHALWMRGLSRVNDKDLIRGTETWCRTKRTPPNLARLCEVIDADPTRRGAPTLAGCPGCDGTGWREIARHYNDADRPVQNSVAACDCQIGQRLAVGPVLNWQDARDKWEKDPYTKWVIVSDAKTPHLALDDRMTKKQLKVLDDLDKQPKVKARGWSRIKP